MFYAANKEQIGKYLSKQIARLYKNQRQFCKKYLEQAGKEINDDEIRKMQNRLRRILNGEREIQIYDLPIFCELLKCTCEEILSAGNYFVQNANRMTNYSIAFSKEKNIWKEYINSEDKLILNSDEYGNTVIDYAIQFKNYDFLKFLIENGFIWFDSGDKRNYTITFGAGTNIKRTNPCRIDDHLQYELGTKDELRQEIIALAIQNSDKNMLDKMRARELPELYNAHYMTGAHPNIESDYNENLIHAVINADDETLNYFTDEFQIADHVKYKDGSKRSHTFLFPFISEVITGIIKNKSNYAEFALKKVITHNKWAYNTLISLIENAIETNSKEFDFMKPAITKVVLNNIYFYENGNIISFGDTATNKGIITNIVHTDAESKDPKINDLILELNTSFNKIVHIKEEYNAGEKII